MKEFLSLEFDPLRCQAELQSFRQLLDGNADLREEAQILPFFREHLHLSAFIGSYNSYLSSFSKIAFEYPIYGDFKADLVIGGVDQYCLVEFEDAGLDSIFKRRGEKATREWSPRFEHGFSQLVDWFWKMDDMRQTDDFRHRFGASSVDYVGILVAGRDAHLEPSERARLRWRRRHVIVHSKAILSITFDELCADLSSRLQSYIGVGP